MADVLLIEDDPHQRALAAMVLGSAGHRVREAGDGAEGLRAAREEQPELVVCDVVMPGTNGYQFVSALRADPVLCTTPVILLTTLTERQQVRTGMTSGADDYLAKPCRPAELLEAVDSLLKRRKSQREAIVETVREDYDHAMERQRQQLALRYETQLLHELNGKWKHDVAAGAETAYAQATVLVADVFDTIAREGPAQVAPADLLRRADEAARDALYLFGARHVLQHGPDLLAVFVTDGDDDADAANAARAAFALHSAVARTLGTTTSGQAGPVLAVGVDTGPFSLVRLQDPLHGDGGVSAVPGPTLERAQALRQLSREHGWWIAGSAGTARRVPPAQGLPGARDRVERLALDACELQRPA